MKTTCPHCSQSISIDAETLASLQGSSHFECPACADAVAVPLVQGSQPITPLRITDAEAISLLRPPIDSDETSLHATHHGINRNLLILGSMALLVLGGLAAFIASRKDGNVHNTTQNIRNEIINNTYFQNLIATGATTTKDLEAISDIRPYEEGFIGITSESLEWEQANELARRTGSQIVSIGDPSGTPREELMKWLADTFKSQISPSAWIRERGEARVLVGSELLAATDSKGMRRALLQWKASQKSNTFLAEATKDQPFVNSFGMKFVPVPGTDVLFCIHETRRKDYAEYAKHHVYGINSYWQKAEKEGIPSGHEDDHPVVGVGWGDAREFCRWLSEKEGKTYRLPTDREWSHAVGIAHLESENPDSTGKRPKIPDHFPWEGKLPLRADQKIGNLGDATWHEKFPSEGYIENYMDGFATTAPVMSFPQDRLGIYDLAGNVSEWVEDSAGEKGQYRILRGGSFSNGNFHVELLSSNRNGQSPNLRWYNIGFRVVVEFATPKANAPTQDGRILDPAANLIGDPSRKFMDILEAQVRSEGDNYVLEVVTAAPFPAPSEMAGGKRFDFICFIDSDKNRTTGQSGRGNDYNIHMFLDETGWHSAWFKVSSVSQNDGIAVVSGDFRIHIENSRATLIFPKRYLPGESFEMWASCFSGNSPNWLPLTENPPTQRTIFNF